MLFRFLSYLIRLVRKEHEKEVREIERKIVQKYSRGNVRLQLGRYLTERDIDKMRENILRLKF